jgi:hypothetical protein
VGQWPTGESLIERLAARVAEAAERDPGRKRTFKMVARELGCMAKAMAINVNYPWSQTDKRYIKRLAGFRTQADDVLHRPISKTPDLLTIENMPQRVAVNRLLQKCISAVTAMQPVQSVS